MSVWFFMVLLSIAAWQAYQIQELRDEVAANDLRLAQIVPDREADMPLPEPGRHLHAIPGGGSSA